MKIHHTKNKGDLAVLKVQYDLYNKGYICFFSASEHQPFDFIAYKNKYPLLRIQVKYISARNNSITLKFAQNWADKNGNHTNKVEKSEIDYYAIYCPDIDIVFYVNPSKYTESITIRLKSPKNNQVKNINNYQDFIELN